MAADMADNKSALLMIVLANTKLYLSCNNLRNHNFCGNYGQHGTSSFC